MMELNSSRQIPGAAIDVDLKAIGQLLTQGSLVNFTFTYEGGVDVPYVPKIQALPKLG